MIVVTCTDMQDLCPQPTVFTGVTPKHTLWKEEVSSIALCRTCTDGARDAVTLMVWSVVTLL